jgi:NH3-dependent NAD+ synthetase
LDDILQHPSSADLAAGLPNETAIGLKYAVLDRVLAGFSLQMPDDEIAAETGLKRPLVMNIRMACRLANERREMPASIPAPAQNQGYIRSRTSNRPIGGK